MGEGVWAEEQLERKELSNVSSSLLLLIEVSLYLKKLRD